ncbi:DUF5691 domain-containing protein [Rhizohabitans arisaemae]|uniref:DUF5691 domain-containing protein n=1 Tax=Rhizohabitans arisaemae TaxID=2720610 RepID=UPI0024B23EF0|nr:DUF5691 domain-containing protein [Rhizohabitans arisaemae]
MNDARSWEDLVSAALLGTERKPDGADGPDDPAAGLLHRAAALTVAGRAGRLPSRVTPPVPAEPEECPRAGREAADRLARILAGQQQRVLPEWLDLAARRRLRAPGHLLPELLDRGRNDRSLREPIAVVAGRRGRWLAGHNPHWAYLLRERSGGVETWELGAPGERLSYLERLRGRDPAAARETLRASWRQETPDDRALFTAALAEGLSAADEPFLEEVLEDRRREVRVAAANLLVRIPGSRYGRRMADRLGPRLRDGGLIVDSPPGCDAAMERDGVWLRRGATRSELLEQLVGKTPLGMWADRVGAPPQEIVELNRDRHVRAGWVRAAISQRDAVWAGALLDGEPDGDLLAVLPAGPRARRAAKIVRAWEPNGALITLLGAVPAPWSGPLALAVLAKIEETSRSWYVDELCRLAALRLDPGFHPAAGRLSADPPPSIEELVGTLRFRSDMRSEFSP